MMAFVVITSILFAADKAPRNAGLLVIGIFPVNHLSKL